MPSRLVLGSGIAIIVLGALVMFAWLSRTPAIETPAPVGSAAVDTLSNASSALERRIAELEIDGVTEADATSLQAELAQIKTQLAEIRGVLARLEVPQASEPLDDLERGRREQQLTQDTFVLLEQTLQTQARDDAWSREAERSIGDAFVSLEQTGKLRLEAAECRATLCSVTIRSSSPGDFREIDVTEALAENFASGILTTDGTTARMFLSREGAELPRLAR